MPLALLILFTVPVRLSVRNTSCPLHISYTLFYHVGVGAIMVASVRPSDGRSVGPSVHLHYRVRSIHPIPIEGFSSNLAAMGFKYITMSEIYAVLVLWNITL